MTIFIPPSDYRDNIASIARIRAWLDLPEAHRILSKDELGRIEDIIRPRIVVRKPRKLFTPEERGPMQPVETKIKSPLRRYEKPKCR